MSHAQTCDYLADTKPVNCPNPVGMPVGANFGKGAYAGGSGLAKAIALMEGGEALPWTRQSMQYSLARHTSDLAKRTIPKATADETLKIGLRSACQYQEATALPGAYGTSKCAMALARIHQESGWGNWFTTFKNWIETNDIDLGVSVLSLQSVVSAISPDNSLTAKFNKIDTQAKCATWWQNYQQNQCGVP